jgi:hypothetical protein
MLRERLIWFAFGTAFGALAVVCAQLARPARKDDHTWYVRVAESGQSMRDGQASAKWRGAEIARDCGARSFELMPGVGSDSSDGTRIPLIKENNPALGCVVEGATRAGLWVGVGLEEPLRSK